MLREAGWLVLNEAPPEPRPFDPSSVDWTRTRAWGDGGYYARIFLTSQGASPPASCRPSATTDARRARELLRELPLRNGPRPENAVVWPERAYRRVRGLAPDLLVFFGDLHWRSLGSVGFAEGWFVGNDTGADEANHARHGFYALRGPGVPARGTGRPRSSTSRRRSLDWLGMPLPATPAGAARIRGGASA